MAITNPAVAVAVINEAKARGVYAGDMPEADTDKLKTGNELLKMAEEAKQAGVQAEAVHAVIAAAQQEAGATSVPANPFGGAASPVAAPAPTPAPTPAPVADTAPPVPAPAPAVAPEITIDLAIPGYDDLKVSDILIAMEQLNDAGIAFVKAYEADEGQRVKILSFERGAPAPEAAPAPAPTPAPVAEPVTAAPTEAAPAPGVVFSNAQPSEYATTEPWAGYSKAKISDIVAVVEDLFRTQGEGAKPLLAHVWEFESNNKERTRLITKLTEIATNGVQVTPPTTEAPTPAPVAEPAGVVAEVPFAQPVAEVAAPNAFAAVEAAPPVAAPAPAPSNPAQTGTVPQPLSGATQHAQAVIATEGLPIPGPVTAPPVLPEDFTILGDVEVRKFQSQFNACQARAHYLLSIAEGHSNDAKIAADGMAAAWIFEQSWPAKITVTEQNAKASQIPEVANARAVQHEYAELARQHRALRDIYASTCDRLSREQTGRQSEHATAR